MALAEVSQEIKGKFSSTSYSYEQKPFVLLKEETEIK